MDNGQLTTPRVSAEETPAPDALPGIVGWLEPEPTIENDRRMKLHERLSFSAYLIQSDHPTEAQREFIRRTLLAVLNVNGIRDT